MEPLAALVTEFDAEFLIDNSALSEDGEYFAAWGELNRANTVNVWMINGPKVEDVKRLPGLVAEFCRGKPPVVAVATDNSATLYTLPEMREVRKLEALGERETIRALRCSPDGKTIAGATDSQIVLWDATTGRVRRKARFGVSYGQGSEHTYRVLRFSPDGKRLASSSWNRTAFVWAIDDLSVVAKWQNGVPISAIEFVSGGDLYLAGGIAQHVDRRTQFHNGVYHWAIGGSDKHELRPKRTGRFVGNRISLAVAREFPQERVVIGTFRNVWLHDASFNGGDVFPVADGLVTVNVVGTNTLVTHGGSRVRIWNADKLVKDAP